MNELKPCPFCNGQMYLTVGYAGMNFLLCGEQNYEGCGAVISFRPDVRGSAAIKLFNERAKIKELEHPEPAQKPHGRLAWKLHMNAGGSVDLSVFPKLENRK